MQSKELITLLDTKVTSTRENRSRIASIVLNDKNLFLPLLESTFKIDDPVSIKAAWVLEYVLKENLEWLYPHLSYFINNLSKVYRDSAVRPTTKICEILAQQYTSTNNEVIKNHLTDTHIETLLEVCFDRLISRHKVAVKVYAMETLFLLGKDTDWVYDELKLIIQQKIHQSSAAYKARGKKTLIRIQKLQNKKNQLK